MVWRVGFQWFERCCKSSGMNQSEKRGCLCVCVCARVLSVLVYDCRMLMKREWTICRQPNCEANGCANVLANKGETNLAEFKNMTTFHLLYIKVTYGDLRQMGSWGLLGNVPWAKHFWMYSLWITIFSLSTEKNIRTDFELKSSSTQSEFHVSIIRT